VIERVLLDGRRLADHVERRVSQPLAVVDEPAAERQPQEGIGAAPGDLAHDGLEQRPRLRVAPDEHLPARLHVQAGVDEQRRVTLGARVGHGGRS
jgi:hypothetical protein